MSKFDDWLEAPYQDDLRNGEAREALEQKYQDSDEFYDAFEIWQRDSFPEFYPVSVSTLDTFISTKEYERGLSAYIEQYWEGVAE